MMNLSMKHMLRQRQGFALPTILIASVIMLTVLMSAVTAVSSITGGINSQYYNQLAREAAESGLANAENCLRASDYNPTWTDAAPLKPDKGCTGATVAGYGQWVVTTANLRTTFTVARPTVGTASSLRIVSVGTVELLRSSVSSSPWRTYTVTVTKNSRYNDTPQIAGGAGFQNNGHNGYMLASSGLMYAWGDNTNNQIGASSLGTFIKTPIKVDYPNGVSRAKKIANSGQGASIVCILATNSSLGDQVYCRGETATSLGGTTWQRFGLSAGLTATDMVVNGFSTNSMCVLASNKQAYCAGFNTNGQLGNGITNGATVPMSAPTKFRLDLAVPAPPGGTTLPLTAKKVYNQDTFTCVIASDNRAYCAGDNNWGQLGQGNWAVDTAATGKSVPGRALIPGDPPVDEISLPYHGGFDGVFYHASDTGMVYMSGHNGQGTANDLAFNGSCVSNGGAYNCYPTPRSISGGGYGKMISIGEQGADLHTMCLLTKSPSIDSGLWCLGRNDYGQLGAGDCIDRAFYAGAANLQGRFVSSAAMNKESSYQMNSMMVITTSGEVYAAGDNTYGKLGTNAALQACNPTYAKVQLPAGVKAVALANGDEYTAFILGDNNKVYSMGRNNNGQLGNGTLTNSKVPVEVKLPRQETVY